MNCALSLPKMCSLVLVLAKKFAALSPLSNGAEFTLSVAQNVPLFEAVRILRFAHVKWRNRGWKHRNKWSNFRLHRPSSLTSKKWINLIPKTIGKWKRDCAWGCARGIDTTWENLQIEKHKSGRRSLRSRNWFVLFDLQIFLRRCLSPERNLTHNLFSISNSFWYQWYISSWKYWCVCRGATRRSQQCENLALLSHIHLHRFHQLEIGPGPGQVVRA